MIKTTNFKKGFSLIELMIVVAVMAILSTVGFFAYNNFQKSAKDAKRQSDLKTIATAVQAYYTDNGKFPTSAGAQAGTTGHEDANLTNGILTSALATYGGKAPSAPATTAISGENVEYQYAWKAEGDKFALCAQLEAQTGKFFVVTQKNPSGTVDDNVACDQVNTLW